MKGFIDNNHHLELTQKHTGRPLGCSEAEDRDMPVSTNVLLQLIFEDMLPLTRGITESLIKHEIINFSFKASIVAKTTVKMN